MATWKTVTVASGGGDYTSLSAALAAEATDVTAQVGDLIISCENFSDTTVVNTSGQLWTTNATHRVLIQIADNHNLTWSASVYRLETTQTCITNSTIDHLEISGIQCREHGTINGERVLHMNVGLDSGTFKLEKFILISDHNDATDSTNIVELDDNSQTYKLSNGVMYADQSGSSNVNGINVGGITAAANVWIDNVTIDSVDNGLALGSGSGNIRARNTRITSVNVAVSGGSTLHADSDFNLTDNSAPTNWGANSIDSGDAPAIGYVDDSNATMTSRDYHMSVDTDSGHETGTDLSGDANNPFSDDGAGTTRTVPWDIGAHEFSSGVAAVASVKRSIHNKTLNAAQIRGAFF